MYPTGLLSSMSLVSQRKLAEAAEKSLKNISTLEEALEFLYKNKPPYLNCGYEHWVDKKKLDEDIKGLRHKFIIHGYGDRAERIQYLLSVLEKKWGNKPDAYKCMMTFLTEMTDRPTEVLGLIMSGTDYSETLEEDEIESSDSDSEEAQQLEREREEFRKQVVQELLETSLELKYSSESELSDWQLSDADEFFPKDKHTSTPTAVPLRLSLPLTKARRLPRPVNELRRNRNIPSALSTAEIQRRNADRHWDLQEMNAVDYIRKNIRLVEPRPLTFQPVISTRMLLHTRFGEFWEWKKRGTPGSGPKLPRFIVMENDIIRELIWQLTSPNTKNSVIFNSEWRLKPGIMVSSLSQLTLQSFMDKYGKALEKLEKMRTFISGVQNQGYNVETNSRQTPPQMYSAYAHSLSEVLSLVTRDVDGIERNLKMNRIEPSTDNQLLQPCSTLLQVDKLLEACVQHIEILDSLHNQCVTTNSESDSAHWLKSIKLISCLEEHLSRERRPKMYGLVLYMFSKCLASFLQELLCLLDRLDWKNEDFLFKKDREVKLEHSDFWERIVVTQPILENLKDMNIEPLSCLKTVLPHFLTVLKVSEMIHQLNDDFKLVLVGPLPTYEEIVKNFLNAILPTPRPEPTDANAQYSIKNAYEPDYEKHFMFLGLQDSLVATAFEYILQEHKVPVRDDHLRLETFAGLTEIPIQTTNVCLEKILVRSLEPYFEASRRAFNKLFQEYGVERSLRLFREIMLGGREDFALAVIQLSRREEVSREYAFEKRDNRDPKYQKLLDDFYPEGRSNFEVRLLIDSLSETNVMYEITPHFPLNLILTNSALKIYKKIARQLHRIRRSLQVLNQLSMKCCKVLNGIEPNRILIIRFCLIHLCSSLRSYLLITLFTKEARVLPDSEDDTFDVNEIRTAHEMDLHRSVWRILSHPQVESIFIKHIVLLSSCLEKYWTRGLTMNQVAKIEITIQHIYNTINSWNESKHAGAMNELAHYFPPCPVFF